MKARTVHCMRGCVVDRNDAECRSEAYDWIGRMIEDGCPETGAPGMPVGAVYKGRRWISHCGGVAGHNALSLRYPEGKLSVSILTNLEGVRGARSLAMAIAER